MVLFLYTNLIVKDVRFFFSFAGIVFIKFTQKNTPGIQVVLEKPLNNKYLLIKLIKNSSSNKTNIACRFREHLFPNHARPNGWILWEQSEKQHSYAYVKYFFKFK